ncbi:MAG: hypothetical protein HUJ29_06865, partial [Gammaproteobacteria bacterium]|nr:hypothetical protein [Gammaproteobacteria bacterium]
MKLILIIISLWTERHLGKYQSYRNLPWMNAYFSAMENRLGQRGFWHGLWGVVLVLLPPLIVVALVYGLLWYLFIPLAYLFALFILILMLGPLNLEEQVKQYLESRKPDADQAA